MLKSFRWTAPSPANIDMICDERIVIANNQVVAVYKKANCDLTAMRNACLRLKFPEYERTSGLRTHTLNINASPRNGKRKRMCTKSKFSREFPKTHDIFLDYAREIAKEYRKYFPQQYAEQVRRMYIGKHKVEAEYRIKGTPFTSGVINENSALGYHRDQANTKNGISCMFCLKSGVGGGELVLPELGIGFDCQDGYLLLFDGHKYIHGVTRMFGGGYRYTTVFYNNKGMSLCLSPEEEEDNYKRYMNNKWSKVDFK